MLYAAAGALTLTLLAILAGGMAREGAWAIWLLLGIAAPADLLLSLTRGKSVTASFPAEVFVGETNDLELEVTPAPDRLTGRIDWPEGLSAEPGFRFRTDGSRAARARVPLRAVRRGAWDLDRLWLIWPSRLGLFEYLPRLKLDLTVRVVPNIRLVQSGKITSTVVSTLFGAKENRAIGEGSEFHQLRDFVPGMDVKSIDWKRSAHRGSLVAKELRAERNHHVIIALDNGYLMREEIAGLPKIDHAITAALATAWAAAIGGDLVGFFSYDVRPRIFTAPEPGRAAFARLRSRTADLEYVARDTNHTLAMAALSARTPKRSLIIVFTDFVDTTSAELMVENMALLTSRHLVVFVTLRDPEVENLVTTAPDTMGEVATLVSANQALAERRLVLERLNRLGVTVVEAEPGKVTARLISTYLEIKAQELI